MFFNMLGCCENKDSIYKDLIKDRFSYKTQIIKEEIPVKKDFDFIYNTTNDNYILMITLPGFSKKEIKIKVKETELIIKAKKQKQYENIEFVEKHISTKFKKVFNITGYSLQDMNEISLKNGILCIYLNKDD